MGGNAMKAYFRLADYSTTFSTRSKADEIANNFKLMANDLRNDSHLVVDFSGVEAISYSFLDQLIGRISELPLLNEKRISFANWSDSLVSVIDKSLEHRSCSYSSSGYKAERVLVCQSSR